MSRPGALVAVVGPSGAGKDTVLAGARAELAGEGGFRMLRRAVTRPAGAGGEDHLALSREAFERERDRGGFALWWEAHGLHYGIPRLPLEAVLARGEVAIANLSRRVLAEAGARFPLHVVEVTAPPAMLAARLAARGRETATDIEARLRREAPLPPGLRLHRVLNDATPEEGAARLLAVLRAIASGAPLDVPAPSGMPA